MTRIAVVDKSKCNPVKCNYLCRSVCPINRQGDSECILIDEDKKIKINESLCIDKCSICVKKCPFDALSIVNLPAELDKKPIHRYTENGFALYNLASPLFNKVTGIIGRNGIGKSTAIKILAGLIKPNLGKFSKQTLNKEIIDYFKGTEAQEYFTKLLNNRIKSAFKPQQVDLIPKQFKGKVIELLKTIEKDEKRIKDVSEKTDIIKILDRNIETISGGELQRVAITATILKKADVYFFDEPTSYLDIKQRLKISKTVQSLKNEKTAIVLIEHDLIILDYLSDLIYIMFGKQGIYGITSHVKTTKLGINTYLSGYSKDENIRFRDKPINFIKATVKDNMSGEVLTEWKEFETKLGNFQLKAKKGKIHKNEIIGVVGENGIGKTSFVKELAKNNNFDNDIKISYKAQYLKSNNSLVIDVLADAMKYKNQLINPLQIEHILYRQLDELSGGELQRVAIALCLSRDADIYLLDEPSAYLDVEQRIQVGKVIKEFIYTYNKSAIIVDHDLLMIDYLSDRLIVFEGEPAIKGLANSPSSLEKGMNEFLKDLKITFRRDQETHRPRANKIDSRLDKQQKQEQKYYYT